MAGVIVPPSAYHVAFDHLSRMTTSDAQMAADYWRYTTHVALLALYAPVMALAVARWPVWMKLRGRVLVGGGAAGALRHARSVSEPEGLGQTFLRDAVADMRDVIPLGSKVVIILFWNSALWRGGSRQPLAPGILKRQLGATIVWEESDFEKVKLGGTR